MGFADGLFKFVEAIGKEMDAKKTKEYEKCKNFSPEKLLLERDKVNGDIPKLTALNLLYREKAKKMSAYDLKRLTQEAREHCSVDTYNFAYKIYQEIKEERDPWL